MLLHLASVLGAFVLVATALGLGWPRCRAQAIVVGSAGMVAGAVAVFAYTMFHFLRGVDLDFIPHELAAEWFVAAFGGAGLLAAVVTSAVPSLRARLRRELERAGAERDDGRPARPRRVA